MPSDGSSDSVLLKSGNVQTGVSLAWGLASAKGETGGSLRADIGEPHQEYVLCRICVFAVYPSLLFYQHFH